MKKQLLTVTLCLASIFAQAQTATVYALQDGSSTGMANVKSRLTILNIDATAISGTVKSISIYANGKEAISGPVIIYGGNVTTPAGSAPSAYASSGQSDVVMVSGGSKTCTVYLLPVNLTKGVKVTVQTEDGKFYSQDFTSIDAGGSNNLTFSNTTANNLWMATIPGNTYFSFLSTPGAHDAATSGVTSYTTSSKCQDMTLEGLLKAGVRCFDIRPGYYYTSTISADNLYVYHGQVSTNVLYKDAIKTLADFVKDNPTEAITIVMVKENCKPTFGGSSWTDRSTEMWAVVNAVQEQYKSYMKVLDHSYYTLDDFRGKICYINRTGTSVPYTTQITNWPDNGTVSDYKCVAGLCNANVQDEYNKNGANKQNAVKGMLALSSGNIAYKNIYFNYCSSANSPANYAKATNPVISEYLTGDNISGPTGYILADYIGSSSNGGAALLAAIINQNYRYVYNGRAAGEELAGENWDLAQGSNVIWSKKGNWADGYGAASDMHVTENYAGWGSLEQTDFSLTRDVVLPAGTYTLTVYALYRDGSSAKFVAKSGSEILASAIVAPMTSISGVGSNDLEKAANAFTGDNYLHTLSFTLAEPTMVTVGYEGRHSVKQQWFVAGPVTLEMVAGPQHALGDVNGDGDVNVEDLTTLIEIILGNAQDTYKTADLTGDGNITKEDAEVLVNILLGK